MEQNAQIKAIDLKGIVRNASKLTQQDGEMDELINLRLKDGSWQPTGDGKIVFEMPDGHFFSQMYVHTNIYRHVLGVENGALHWIANIDKDSNFYTGAEGEADNEYHADAYSLFWQNGVYTPIKICDVSGKVTIAQTGHLLIMIDEADTYVAYVFSEAKNEYENQDLGTSEDNLYNRKKYPYGNIFFNYWSPCYYNEPSGSDTSKKHYPVPYGDSIPYVEEILNSGSIYNYQKQFWDKQEERGHFTRPFFVCAAVRLFDGNIAFPTNPVLIFPRQNYLPSHIDEEQQSHQMSDSEENKRYHINALSAYFSYEKPEGHPTKNYTTIYVKGCSLVMTIKGKNTGVDKLISKLCIFCTASPYTLTDDGNPNIGYTNFRPYYFRSTEKIREQMIENPIFYLVKEYEWDSVQDGTMIVDIQTKVISEINSGNVAGKEVLPIDAFANSVPYFPKTAFSYNSRFHVANYKTYNANYAFPLEAFMYSGMGLVKAEETQPTISENFYWLNDTSYPKWIRQDNENYLNEGIDVGMTFYPLKQDHDYPERLVDKTKWFGYVELELANGDKGYNIIEQYPLYGQYEKIFVEGGRMDIMSSLNPLICIPVYNAQSIKFVFVNLTTNKIYKKQLKLKQLSYYGLSYYLADNLKPIPFDEAYGLNELEVREVGRISTFPNGLKVSAVNNPLYFPVESTYQVGSSEIVALMSNTKAVGTGQTGEAPLYVFTKDGVYGLFVDSSGEVAYSTARILTRDVCNNADSVTPIDDGVVFTTDRGLMLMAGEEAKELSQPAEGEPNHFTKVSDKVEYCKIAANALELGALANMANQYTKEDLLEFLKGCIINYNHNERELMVSNPSKNYTYILDREGNWSKRDYTASEYVNNFPTSYRVQNLKFYKVDEESNADNGVYLLTRPIKLDTLAYKQAFRCVVRGVFELMNGEQYAAEQRIATVEPKLILTQLPSRLQSQKDDGGRELYNFKVDKEIVLQRYTIKEGGYTTVTFMEDEAYLYVVGNGCVVRMSGHIELSVWKKTEFNGHDTWVNVGEVVGRDIAVDDNHITMPLTDLDNSGESYININKAQAGEYELRLKVVMDYDSTAYSMQDVLMTENNGFAVTIDHAGKIPLRLGLYVFGSYDGRKWAMIGGKEKTGGMFTDIGCKVERTDIKFLRLCVAGQLKQTSKIDFVEITTEPKIHDKLR